MDNKIKEEAIKDAKKDKECTLYTKDMIEVIKQTLVNEGYKVSERRVSLILKTLFSRIIELVAAGYEINLGGFGKFHKVFIPPQEYKLINSDEYRWHDGFYRPMFKASRTFRREIKNSRNMELYKQETDNIDFEYYMDLLDDLDY